MADDKKVKKKKTKKVEKESEPEPEPTPAPAPEPVAEEAAAPVEGEEPVVAEGEEGAPPADGEDMAEPPPAPKKKPKFYVHWNRRKPRFYDYNFDFGESYYSNVVSYLDTKPLGVGTSDIPRRLAWAERGIASSLMRKNRPDVKTETILSDARSSIRNFESFQKSYVVEPGFRRRYL